MRIVKDAKERRNEILDVAEWLFSEKGFDNTSTNDILTEIGIARGTTKDNGIYLSCRAGVWYGIRCLAGSSETYI